MRTLLLFLLILCGALVLAACDPGETQQTIDLMTRAAWTPVDSTAAPGLAERYEFRDDGRLTLTFADGSTRRTEWALDEGATVLVVRDVDGSQLDLPIVTLTEDDLVLDFGSAEVAFVHV